MLVWREVDGWWTDVTSTLRRLSLMKVEDEMREDGRWQMIIELVEWQRALWPWNSKRGRKLRKVCLWLCVCPMAARGGPRVCRFIWTASGLKLPPRCWAAGQNYVSSCCSTGPAHRVHERARKPLWNREDGWEAVKELRRTSHFYHLRWFVLVFHMEKILWYKLPLSCEFGWFGDIVQTQDN